MAGKRSGLARYDDDIGDDYLQKRQLRTQTLDRRFGAFARRLDGFAESHPVFGYHSSRYTVRFSFYTCAGLSTPRLIHVRFCPLAVSSTPYVFQDTSSNDRFFGRIAGIV